MSVETNSASAKRYAFFGGIWMICVSTIWVLMYFDLRQEFETQAMLRAETVLNKDVSFRMWAAGHGGIYVPITEDTPPNPYLDILPDRDVTTTDGKHLTLMNPAYMIRQVMKQYEGRYGVKGHITSLVPINSGNTADEWEISALKKFEEGDNTAATFQKVDGELYHRRMIPLVTQQECLKCHERQGYKEGDIRGGLSVAIPVSALYSLGKEHHIQEGVVFMIFFTLCVVGVYVAHSRVVRTRDQLAFSERYLRALIDKNPECIKLVDENGSLIEMNPAGLKMIEADTLEQVRGASVASLVGEKYRQGFLDFTRNVCHGEEGRYEFRIVGLKGTERWLETNSGPFRDKKTGRTLALGVTRDITKRKAYEERLRKSEADWANTFDSISDFVSIHDLDFRFVKVNKALARYLERSPQELIGKHCYEIMHDTASPWCNCPHQTTLSEGCAVSVEVEDPHLGISLLVTTSPLFDDGGELFGSIHIAKDVSALKEAEAETRRVAASLAKAQRIAHFGNWEWDIGTGRLYWSDEIFRICGESPEAFETTYEMFLERVHPEDRAIVSKAVENALNKGDTYSIDHRIIRPDGILRIVHEDGEVERDEHGEAVKMRGVVHDVTELRNAQEEAQKAERLESLGILAGGIAHDFNNLLQTIFANVSLAKMYSERGTNVYRTLESIEHALGRTTGLTQQLLTFAKGGAPVRKIQKIGPLIEEAVRFALSGSNINTQVMTAPDLWSVDMDAGQINQVFQNLTINARDAMQSGGTLTVAARNEVVESGQFNGLAKGGYVRISVSDTGEGISREDIVRIFDPYFTTKRQGNGLGLAISYSVIKAHRGVITVKSELGKGTEFEVFFPAVETEPDFVDEHVGDASVSGMKVLVMDDEKDIREVCAEMLKAMGHEVEVCEKGEMAIEIYRKELTSGKPFDFVILDLTIKGGMGGAETIGRLSEIDPDIVGVLSSGYGEMRGVGDWEMMGFRAVLPKPYKMEDLAQTIRNVAEQGKEH